MLRILSLVLTLLTLFQAQSAVQSDTHTYIVSTDEDKVVVIDRKTGVEKVINVGNRPQSITLSEGFGFVVNFGSNTISVIDLKSHTVTDIIHLGQYPDNLLIHKGVGYVSCSHTDVYVIDLKTRKVSIKLLDCGHSMIIHGEYGYLRNNRANCISVIDLRVNAVLEKIPTGLNPQSFVISNGYGYVVNTESNDVSVIDLENHVNFFTISVGQKPQGLVIHDGFGFVLNSNSTISLIDLKALSVAYIISLRSTPESLFIHNGMAYVLHKKEKKISIIDLKTYTVSHTLSFDEHPFSMVIHNGYGYVAVVPSGKIPVINLQTNQIVKTLVGKQSLRFSFSDTHLYLGINKFIPFCDIEGVRLFDSPYTGLEILYSEGDPDQAFKKFEQAMQAKRCWEAKSYLDVALNQGHAKAYAVAFYAFVKGVWGATQSDEWAKEFTVGMDHDYYLRLSHKDEFPHDYILKPQTLPSVYSRDAPKKVDKKALKKAAKSKKKSKKKAKEKAKKAKSKAKIVA